MRVRTISLALVTVAAAFGRVLTAAPPTSQAAAELSGVVQVPAGMRLVAGRGGGRWSRRLQTRLCGWRGPTALCFLQRSRLHRVLSRTVAACPGSDGSHGAR
jgi:hypothetical protein